MLNGDLHLTQKQLHAVTISKKREGDVQMKIAVRGGHNTGVPGAHGIVDEIVEDRRYSEALCKYLVQLGHTVMNVTPAPTQTSAADLTTPVSRANSWGAELFLSCHVNAAGGVGVETLYHDGAVVSKQVAERIAVGISSLGFRNRGAKADVRGLYEMHATNMPAVIIEPFFCDSQSDVDIYHKVGFDQLGKTIAEAVTMHKLPVSNAFVPVAKTVTADALHVRSKPDVNSAIIGTLHHGDVVKVGGEVLNGWVNIFYGTNGGYVAAQYIK